jgi:hypothetical protein
VTDDVGQRLVREPLLTWTAPWVTYRYRPTNLGVVGSNPARCAKNISNINVLMVKPCPFRKLYPGVAMVQSAEERHDNDGAESLDWTMVG